jgi:hypothetical protein
VPGIVDLTSNEATTRDVPADEPVIGVSEQPFGDQPGSKEKCPTTGKFLEKRNDLNTFVQLHARSGLPLRQTGIGIALQRASTKLSVLWQALLVDSRAASVRKSPVKVSVLVDQERVGMRGSGRFYSTIR